MEFISIGPHCNSADIIRDNGLRKLSYPFDYVFSSLEMVKHCIDDRFNVFLDRKYHRYCSNNSMFHIFYSNMIDTEILRKHHIANQLYDVANNLKNREIFIHHSLFNNDTYESFVRRCNRLMNLIDNQHKIVFVYHNSYTTDIGDILDFSNHFSDKAHIFTVGIFENDYDKQILFENSRCKIYQNYNREFIFNDVQSIF